MRAALPFITTRDALGTETITVYVGIRPYSVPLQSTRGQEVSAALKAGNYDRVVDIINTPETVAKKLGQFGSVEVFGGHVTLNGEEIHGYLIDRILHLVNMGGDVRPLTRFLENVQANPSRRAVQDLYKWCEAGGLPITPDGCITAYKIVRNDYRDIYSGKFDNSIGKVCEVRRNEVDDNPDRTCSHGLHFCSAAYLPHYGTGGGSRVMIVKVNPADVVAFPTDYNLSKARCSKYTVIGEVPREEAAQYFRNSDFVFTGMGQDDLDEDLDAGDLTITDRLENIEDELGLDGEDETIDDRLTAIYSALGITRPQPMIAAVEAAERQLGIG